MATIRELREQLTDEKIKDILGQFNVEAVNEDAERIIFPTCCHNIEGGSPKLYYYKNSKLFHCYTECGDTFDIFTLLQKMYKLREQEITLSQAIDICDLDVKELKPQDPNESCKEEIKYLQTLNNTYIPDIDALEFKEYDPTILKRFSFDYMGLMPWLEEGIGMEAMQRFNIKYCKAQNCIVIPNFDYSGKLIGLRGRFFNDKDVLKGKYRPLYVNNTLYNHPTGRTFYGIYENHKTIERKRTCIIFEGEKSVLLYDTLYGHDNNIAVATLGQNITKDHIQYLLKMKVSHVILAYDTDYEDYKQFKEVEAKYKAKAQILEPYFNVSYLLDEDFLLPYKSSPIDGGKEIFESILRNRRVL